MNPADRKYVYPAALIGEWRPLADYIEDGHALTPDMRRLLAEILRGEREQRKGPPHRPAREKTETRLDGLVVEVLKLQFQGFSKTAAVKKVAELYANAGETTVWRALRTPFAKKFIKEYERGDQELFRKVLSVAFIGPLLPITNS
jgi:hypothetical protein